MGKKSIKNKNQPSNSSLNLKPSKSRQQKKAEKIEKLKATLKKNFFSKKKVENDEELIKEKYSDYFTTVFNSKIIHMIIIYTNKNKDNLKSCEYNTEPNFMNKLIHIIKELYMNEIEVAYFTLLLDKLGWKFPNYDHWIYFYLLGIYCKKKVTGEFESDKILRSLKEELIDKYTDFVNEKTFDDFEKKEINPREINQRYKELTKPINSYCRKNFINYSSIADKIIRLSQPYGEQSNGNQLFMENNMAEIDNNNNNERDILLNNLLGVDYQNNLQNLAALTMRGEMVKINDRYKSIFADKNIYKQGNQVNNMNNQGLELNNFASNFSLIKQRSDNSFTSGIRSVVNDFES